MQPDMTATFDRHTLMDLDGFWAGPRTVREGVFAQLRARDELFFSEEEYEALTLLRRRAASAPPRPAMEGMLKLMEKWDTNAALLAGLSGS